MNTNFSQGKYEIYWYKGQTGDTPMSPVSPENNIATSPVNKTSLLKKGALIGIGLTVAKRTIDTVRNEIGASTGNEVLQTDINNAMKALGYLGTLALGTAGIVLTGADVVLSSITYSRSLRRQNLNAQLERELQGKRLDISKGSAYYG